MSIRWPSGMTVQSRFIVGYGMMFEKIMYNMFCPIRGIRHKCRHWKTDPVYGSSHLQSRSIVIATSASGGMGYCPYLVVNKVRLTTLPMQGRC
jgi:hypothetical protein